jgi:hypothetical protein
MSRGRHVGIMWLSREYYVVVTRESRGCQVSFTWMSRGRHVFSTWMSYEFHVDIT